MEGITAMLGIGVGGGEADCEPDEEGEDSWLVGEAEHVCRPPERERRAREKVEG